MNITKIELLKNVRIKNKHNGVLFPIQDVLLVNFENGEKRFIDLIAKKDFTDIDYLETVFTSKTKYKTIFAEE